MTKHIELGEYKLTQDGIDVGRLVVVPGTVPPGATTEHTVEHWFLYKSVPGTVGETPVARAYTRPSSTNRDVEVKFTRLADAPSPFSASSYRGALKDEKGRSITDVRYTEAVCDEQPVRLAPQIDLGRYLVLQNGVKVGEVEVEQGTSSNIYLEHWYLSTATGGGRNRYTAPGTGTVAYQTTYQPPAGPVTSSPSDESAVPGASARLARDGTTETPLASSEVYILATCTDR
ncbi:MAG TPA: hypothetical protein VE093_26500 [Polyangiaceae bacterium]|jgi:hypothetical protein|nr:hypothetical protein [Polyangiaceae bacterium]